MDIHAISWSHEIRCDNWRALPGDNKYNGSVDGTSLGCVLYIK